MASITRVVASRSSHIVSIQHDSILSVGNGPVTRNPVEEG
jgi:hypothetical protein